MRSANADKNLQRKRDVVKKVIAYMTLGIDVSRLFSEMVLASNTKDLVLKKMVYLYLCNYAATNAELTLLVINTLQKDCRDDDPMIRGLALRSLCSLRLTSIIEYVMVPLKSSLSDTSAYVRKTGIMGILKVYHLSPERVRESDLIDTMYNMLRDRDTVVVANCLSALNEIMADEGGIAINQAIIHHLLTRVRDFNEWGQCIVLSLVARYRPASQEETFQIMNVLDVCLRVSNSAVVLAAAKCFIELTRSLPEIQAQVFTRLKTPLLTLMATQSPETAFCVMAHIVMLVGKAPGIYDDEFKQFFCRYNDPSPMKHLKLDVLPQVANADNAGEIVAELSEYVGDVDAEMARHAIRALGALVIRVPESADRVIETLLELCELEVDYVRGETVKVMQDLLRRYPEKAAEVVPAMHRTLKRIDDPSGKASVIWMVGEYGHLIDDAPYMLEPLINDVGNEESVEVRCELLTATMKLFFKRSPEVQKMLGRLFKATLEGSNSAAVHDRALLYYRLLRRDVSEAQAVISGDRAPITTFYEDRDDPSKAKVFAEFNSLSVVYGKPSEQFISETHMFATDDPVEDPAAAAGAPGAGAAAPAKGAAAGDDDDLLGVGSAPAVSAGVAAPPAPPAPSSGGGDLLGMDDLFGGPTGAPAAPAAPAFALSPSAALDPPQFQAKWMALPVAQTLNLHASKVPSVAEVEGMLGAAHIKTVASGDTGPQLKFYFFGGSAAGAVYLTEVLFDKASQNFAASIKTEDAANAANFVAALRAALSPVVS